MCVVAGVIGRSERKGGILAFDRLVWQVMTKEPYASARRVFWIVEYADPVVVPIL